MTAPTEQAPAEDAAPAAKPSLEDSLAALDEDTRAFVLGEVTKSRTEAKKLRDRLKAAEPKVSEYDQLVAASKTAEERAQEAVTAAERRALAATERVARAELKAALAGVVDNPDAIVADLNLARFVDDDGEIDAEAVKELRDKYAGFTAPRAPRPDASQASGANERTTANPAAEFASFLKQQMSR